MPSPLAYAPGLIGALQWCKLCKSRRIGTEYSIIPVHHIRGHIAANYIAFPELEPPLLSASVSPAEIR